MKQLLGAKHVFARAIKSPCKSFGEGDGEGEGDRPRQTKRPAHFMAMTIQNAIGDRLSAHCLFS